MIAPGMAINAITGTVIATIIAVDIFSFFLFNSIIRFVVLYV